MKVKIEIDTKTFIRFWLVVIGFFIAGAAIWAVRDALVLIIISLFLSLALNAPVNKIAQILPGSSKNRAGATAVAYIIMVIILGAIAAFIVPTIIEQTEKFVKNAPQMIEEVTNDNSSIRQFIVKNNLQGIVSQTAQTIEDSVGVFSKNIGSLIFGSISTLASVIFSIFMILTMTFLMLVEGPKWMEKVWKNYPDKQKQKLHKRIASRMYRAVSAFVNGQLTISLLSGVLGGGVTAILSLTMGVPINLAIPVGVILTTVGLVPLFGATVAGIISALIIGFNVPVAGVIFVIYFLIYQQIENNIISPMIQAKNNQLSALIVIVAITCGIYMFGLLGALLSIPVAACIKILIEELSAEEHKKIKAQSKISPEEFLDKLN